MATPLPFTAPAALRPTIAPPPRSRSDLMAYLLEQNQPDNMIANPPSSVGEGLARTAGMGLDALMAKKVAAQGRADVTARNNALADALYPVGPDGTVDPKREIVSQLLENGAVDPSMFGPSIAKNLGIGDPVKPTIVESIDPVTKTKVFVQSSPGAPDTGFGPGWVRFGGAAGEESEWGPTEVGGLRKEIQALPSYKNYANIKPNYESMVKTVGNNSRASDLNLVYGMAKILDPIGVVRESDSIMVTDTAAIPDWLMGQINRLNGGQALQPETRNQLLAEAQIRVQEAKAAWDRDAQQYEGIANRANLSLADVIPDMGDYTPFAAPPLADTSDPGPDPAEVEAEMRRRGLIK